MRPEWFRRFAKFVDVDSSPTDCWLWTGSLTDKGYARLKVNGEMRLVPRLLWAMLHGPIPEGMLVCHSCDTPPCVNPDHFFLGTHMDNMRDMVAKGRCLSNDWRGRAKER